VDAYDTLLRRLATGDRSASRAQAAEVTA